jgi:DNA-binding response OmpR family regulator
MNAEKIRVLLVEDSATDALIVEEELRHRADMPFSVVQVARLSEALARLETEHFDVVLLDLGLPDSRGFETFARLHHAASEIPVVVLSGQDNEELGVKAVQAGAQDYLVKGRMGEEILRRSIRYAIERQRATRTLSECQARYRLLIERPPDAYIVHRDG